MKSLLSPPHIAKFSSRSNYLYSPNGPSVEVCKTSVDADVHKLNRYHELRYRQDAHERRELIQLSRMLGKPVMAPLHKKIGKDISKTEAMWNSEGKNWPSLAYDFGVSHTKDPATGSIMEASELKLDWDKEKNTNFSGILRFAPHFDTLGLDIPTLTDAFQKMRQVEMDMFDAKFNPYPAAIYGKKAKENSLLEREAASVMARNSFVFIFNKIMDRSELTFRIRFEGKTGPKDLKQNIVFTFPDSDETRLIYGHVFLGHDYPIGGIPMDTSYGHPAAPANNNAQSQAGRLSDLVGHMNALHVREELPPTYDGTTAHV